VTYNGAMSDAKPRTAAVIYNPIKVDLDALQAAVNAEAAAAGWAESTWFETSVDDVGQGVTADAIASGADLLIVAGGDGTVRAVVEAVRGHDLPVALLPSGTGNLLARNLKMTLNDIPDSVSAAFTGEERAIDLGMIRIEREDESRDEHAFVVMAGLGLDAKMITNTDEDLKAKAGWAAYVQAIVKSLRDPNELHLRFRINDGAMKRATVHTLILGNCGSLPANILLMPEAVLDDGLFDVMMTRPGGALGWIRVWVKVAWTNGIVRRTKAGRAVAGRRKNDGDLRYETGANFTARFSRPEEIELDGDAFGKAVAFKAWVEPGKLRVLVPRESN
jgi:diacylglycerol kinase (ATP)